MTSDIRYWLQGEGVQNFGDFLSEYLLRHLFYPQPGLGRELRLIGSCLDDWFVEAASTSRDSGDGGLEGSGPIFWGCGLRRADGLSPGRRSSAEILSVRGPLTRDALRLDVSVPIGDPALLLPALYRPAARRDADATTLLVPHFHETRSDRELLALTGCSAIQRPNIPNDLAAITEFIDRINAADFVLCGAMHAAIIAAAYGRPFAFWDSGDVDLPFKWQDFAASVSMPCLFHADLSAAWSHYQAIAPTIRIPVLWPLLVAAPLPVRPDILVGVMQTDLQRHGPAALETHVSSRSASRLHDRLARMTTAVALQAREHLEALARTTDEIVLRERVATLTERADREGQQRRETARRLQRVDAQHGVLLQRETRLQVRCSLLKLAQTRTQAEMDALQGELVRLRVREATLAAEEARLHVAVQDRNHALEAMRAAARMEAAARAEAETRAAQVDAQPGRDPPRSALPFRVLGRRVPRAPALLRRAARLFWWTVTLQLGRQLRRRSRT